MPSGLARLVEHNNWANARMIEACAVLSDAQLDATPLTAQPWSIRRNLVHIARCQAGYLSLLTLPPEQRKDLEPKYSELQESARASGAGLLELARAEGDRAFDDQRLTVDGYRVESWVVLGQAVIHGVEHRKQIIALMRALGVEPPRLDGWAFAEEVGALVALPGQDP